MQEAAKKPLPLIVPIRPTLRRMMGGSGEPTLDTSQRSEEAAPQGEREGGRTSRCVKQGTWLDGLPEVQLRVNNVLCSVYNMYM